MRLLAVLLALIGLLPAIYNQPAVTPKPPTDPLFRKCCNEHNLDCRGDSCYYQLHKNDKNPDRHKRPSNGTEKDCFEKDGFDLWRQYFIGYGRVNADCCRPKGKNDTMPEMCLDLCIFNRDIGDNTAADYAACEEFRYRINCCNTKSVKEICKKL